MFFVSVPFFSAKTDLLVLLLRPDLLVIPMIKSNDWRTAKLGKKKGKAVREEKKEEAQNQEGGGEENEEIVAAGNATVDEEEKRHDDLFLQAKAALLQGMIFSGRRRSSK